MNVEAIVISRLKTRREELVKQLAGIDAVLDLLGGNDAGKAPKKVKAKKERTPAQIAAIKKAQEARKNKSADHSASLAAAAE